MLIDSNKIEKVVQEIVDTILKPRFNELGMNASGEWLENTKALNNTIIGPSYTQQLVKGREPGKRPPIKPLEIWVNNKLGISGKQATSIAYAISNKIANEGTTWYIRGGTDLLEILESQEVITKFKEVFVKEFKPLILENFRRSVL